MKTKNSRLSLLLAVSLLSLLVVSSFVGVVSASTTQYFTLDSWEVQSVWRGQTFNSTGTFTWNTQFGGVKLTNATNDGKFAFAIRDDSNNGFTFEIYVGGEALGDYLSTDNTIYFKKLTSGAETLLYTSEGSRHSSVKVVYDGSLVELFIDSKKVFQDAYADVTVNQVQYFTENVPLPIGVITQPSCFTGSFSVSVLDASGTSSLGLDSGGITEVSGTMITLMIALLPLTIYMAVFKIIPRMMRGIKL